MNLDFSLSSRLYITYPVNLEKHNDRPSSEPSRNLLPRHHVFTINHHTLFGSILYATHPESLIQHLKPVLSEP